MRALLRALRTAIFRVPPARLVKVTVWDARFKVIETIIADAELAAFGEIWSQKIEQPKETMTAYRYYLDLRHLRGSKYSTTRWLYDPSGLAKVLGIPFFGIRIPIYRIPSPDRFNQLLGIDPEPTYP
jgi:hypothetical protein